MGLEPPMSMGQSQAMDKYKVKKRVRFQPPMPWAKPWRHPWAWTWRRSCRWPHPEVVIFSPDFSTVLFSCTRICLFGFYILAAILISYPLLHHKKMHVKLCTMLKWSWIIESAVFCDQIFQGLLYTQRHTKKSSLIELFVCWYYFFNVVPKWSY